MIDSLIVRLGFRVEVDELLRSATWNVSEIICGQLRRLGFSFFKFVRATFLYRGMTENAHSYVIIHLAIHAF